MSNSDMGSFDRRTFLRYGGLVTTGTLFAGCTGNQQTNDAGDNGSGGQTGNTDSNSQPSGNTEFVYATTITPSSLDPTKGSDNLETLLIHNIYDSLLYYTNQTPPKLKPWLAKEWNVADDGKTYTFELRDDATFHNGDPVTAADVMFSVRRMMDMQQGFSWMWKDILSPENVETVDKTTVKMTTNKVFSPLPYTLPFLFIVNKKQIQEHAKSSGPFGERGDYATAWLEENDAGGGPYKLTQRSRKQQIIIEKNDDWWRPWPDGDAYEVVKTKMVQESATIAAMMKQEKVQMSDQWLPLKTYQSLKNQSGVRVSAKATFNPFYIYMHTQRKPLDDIHVRKAISHAFDYKSALSEIMAGDSEQLIGPLPSSMWSHTDTVTVYQQNLEKAKAELAKSQYSASDIELNYTYVTGLTTEKNMGLALQSNLSDLGITLSIQKTPWSKITSLATKKETSPDMLAVYLSFSYADPDTFLFPAWHSSSHGSWTSASWYNNDKVDRLLTKGRRTVEKKDRIPLYEEAQRLISADAPALFVMNQATRNVLAKSVQGFNDNGITGYRQTFHRFSREG